MAQENDDGLDGLIYLRRKLVNEARPDDRRSWKHTFTGGMIHLQIKSGDSYLHKQDNESLELTVPGLDRHRADWEKSLLPCALVYVESQPQGKALRRAWWVDLKNPASYTVDGYLRIPRKNRFDIGLECRKPFSRLALRQLRTASLESINLNELGKGPSKLPNLMQRTPRRAAWDFYCSWKKQGANNPSLGPIVINRTGWAHITRIGRPLPRIMASFELLPAAARIISEVRSWQVLRNAKEIKECPNGEWSVLDFIGLSANITFPARTSSEVTVILRRQTTFLPNAKGEPTKAKQKIWFYSVYEPERRKRKN